MKTFITTFIAIIILLIPNGLQAQTKPVKLNQQVLYKQFIGTWQASIGEDTVEVRECREYGQAFVIDVYRVIRGQKMPFYINNVTYDANERKFKGYLLYPNGGYFTWIGEFTKNNYFSGDIVFNFNPGASWSTFHADFISQTEFTCTNFNQEGTQTIEMKFIKVN